MPAGRIKSPLLVLYGIRKVDFHVRKGSFIGVNGYAGYISSLGNFQFFSLFLNLYRSLMLKIITNKVESPWGSKMKAREVSQNILLKYGR